MLTCTITITIRLWLQAVKSLLLCSHRETNQKHGAKFFMLPSKNHFNFVFFLVLFYSPVREKSVWPPSLRPIVCDAKSCRERTNLLVLHLFTQRRKRNWGERGLKLEGDSERTKRARPPCSQRDGKAVEIPVKTVLKSRCMVALLSQTQRTTEDNI